MKIFKFFTTTNDDSLQVNLGDINIFVIAFFMRGNFYTELSRGAQLLTQTYEHKTMSEIESYILKNLKHYLK